MEALSDRSSKERGGAVILLPWRSPSSRFAPRNRTAVNRDPFPRDRDRGGFRSRSVLAKNPSLRRVAPMPCLRPVKITPVARIVVERTDGPNRRSAVSRKNGLSQFALRPNFLPVRLQVAKKLGGP